MEMSAKYVAGGDLGGESGVIKSGCLHDVYDDFTTRVLLC